jgi:Icc-related predicted phosphoesterase
LRAGGRRAAIRIFFATDIHGSEVCFRKFLNAASAYEADVIILGGDITGKQLVPIVREGHLWRASEGGMSEVLESEQEVDEFVKRVQSVGAYPIVVDADDEQALIRDREYRDRCFRKLMLEGVARWTELADERLRPKGVECYIGLGNDDEPEVEEILKQASWVQYPEGEILSVRGHEMVSWGWSNRTPWDSPREQDEAELKRSLTVMAEALEKPDQAIFNVHCPPAGSGLDVAPAIDEDFRPLTEGAQLKMISVGSTAVREVIEQFQPLLGLHGHVHDSRAVNRIRHSTCLNPGSDYQRGVLRGALVQLARGKVKSWAFTTG